MSSRLRLSKDVSNKLHFLSGRLEIRRNLVARLAVGYSLKQSENPQYEPKESTGYEFNKTTLTGKYDPIFKLLISEKEGRYVQEEEYFPSLLRAHIDNGVNLMYDLYQRINSPGAFLLSIVDEKVKVQARLSEK